MDIANNRPRTFRRSNQVGGMASVEIIIPLNNGADADADADDVDAYDADDADSPPLPPSSRFLSWMINISRVCW